MNTYLLLRDNKKSGPFTADQLRTLGLKPYDLVWLEGKSAAWRYPGEIDELKSFAPVVEEQPYDRFYKKASPESHPAIDTSPKEKKNPVEPVNNIQKEFADHTKTQVHTASGRVFVTMPGNNTKPESTVAAQKSVKKPISQAVQSKEPGKEINEYSHQINADEVALPAETKTKTGKKIVIDDNDEIPVVSRTSSDTRANRQVWTMRGLVAACFLFAGLSIGLFMNYRGQQNDIKELESLVKQIQHTIPSRPADEKVVEESNLPGTNLLDEPAEPDSFVQTEMAEEDLTISKPIVDKKHKSEQLNQTAKNVVDDSSDQVNNVSTVLKQEPEVDKEVPSKEIAKKNLIQQIQIRNNKYKTGILGGISGLELVLVNKSGYPLDKVVVEVNYLGPEKRVVKTQTVYFENIHPGEESTLEVPKSNRGVAIQYSIKQVNSRELDLVHVAR
jgi:hypothetical protein